MIKPRVSLKVTHNRLPEIVRQSPREADQIIHAIALDGQRDVQENFSARSPSSPGEPPGVDTGALKNSINVAKSKKPLSWLIRTGVDYAVHLEFGTSKMAARPYFGPMLMRLEQRIPEFFEGFME